MTTKTKQVLESLLDEHEMQRFRAFRFPADAEFYLTAHALLRTTLSRYSDRPPAAWRFANGENGRPEIAEDDNGNGLSFNLSHTQGLVACAVTRRVAVGIDVEPLDRPVQAIPIASRYFSRHEAQQLADLPPDHQPIRFLELWTLKEAFIKACGGGFSIPLDRFSLECEKAGAWRVSFASDEHGDPSDWQFVTLRPTLRHILAIVIHRPGQPDFSLNLREIETESFLLAGSEIG